MKVNLPITQQEVQLQDDETIVTKTDLKGIIIDANDDFCRISGFSREELLGQNHNLVRHPDMPEAAFADLWRCLKAGLPWVGLVKNRCKNGNFYWVKAHVAPFLVNGRIEGYISSRTRPASDEIAAASTLYREIKAGRQRYFIADGQAYRNTPWVRWFSRPFSTLSLFGKSLISIGVFALAFLLFALITLSSIHTLKVGGPLYEKIAQTKDLVADTMPPPVYLLESWVTTLEMEDAPPDELKRLIAYAGTLSADFEARSKHWDAHLTDEHIRRQLNQEVYPTGKAFLAFRDSRWIPALQSGSGDIKAIKSQLAGLYNNHRESVDRLIESLNRATREIEAESASVLEHTYLQLALVSSFSFIVAVLIALAIARGLNRTLGGKAAYVKQVVSHIGAGNLGISIIRDAGDRQSIIAAMTGMRNRLRQTMLAFKSGADQVRQRSVETFVTAKRVEEASEMQSASASAIAASIEQLTASIAQAADNAQRAREVSDRSEKMAEDGAAVVGNALGAMSDIAGIAKASSDELNALSASSQRIDSVVSVIHEIADQTNLLALNAAIEAARAGESGRGFAVVADEVRKLAERTSTSTVEISQIVGRLREGLAASTRQMDAGVAKVEEGLALASSAKAAIQEMRQSTLTVVDAVADISHAMAEQRAASQDIAHQIEAVAEAIQHNLGQVQAAAGAAENLSTVALALAQTAERFS